MSKEITKNIQIEQTINISTYDKSRCSRDCPFCIKEDGLYQCFIRDSDGEEIEKLDDINDDNYPTADTYGFQRTNYCIEKFGYE